MNEHMMSEDAVVRQYEGLVLKMAGRYARKWPGLVETDELQQAARIGVARAHRAYDPARGSRFITFAVPAVQWQLDEIGRKAVRAKRGGYSIRTVPLGDAAGSVPDRDRTPVQSVVGDTRLDAVWRTVEHLPPRRREAFVQYHRYGRTSPEVAESMNCSHQNAITLVRAAEKQVYAILRGERKVGSPYNYCEPIRYHELPRFTHKSGRFPEYLWVWVGEHSVVGLTPSGNKVTTGWSTDDAAIFIHKKLWVEVTA